MMTLPTTLRRAAAMAAACRAFARRACWRRALSSAGSSPVPETMSYLRDLRSGSEMFLGRRAFSSVGSAVVPETMSYLRDLQSGSEVYLVGTAHISKQSAEEVRAVICSVKPDIVFVELCAARAEAMRARTGNDSPNSDDSLPEPVRQLLKSFGGPGDFGEKLIGATLKAVYAALKQFHGLDPGLEFKVAMDEADEINARLVLGDRDQDKTITALRNAIDMNDVFKMITGSGGVDPDTLDPELAELFKKADWRDPAAAVETLKTRKAAGAMAQLLRTQFPKIASAMLDQRDDIMTNGLLTAAREKGGPSKIVAVVGMAHMDGIEERWEKAQGSGGGVTRISGG